MAQKEELYRLAWEKWPNLQYCMVLEECAELQKEVCKIMRGKGSVEALKDEMADVEIMLEQLKYKFGSIKNNKAIKLSRLKVLLDG